jgi:hypothetical protein
MQHRTLVEKTENAPAGRHSPPDQIFDREGTAKVRAHSATRSQTAPRNALRSAASILLHPPSPLMKAWIFNSFGLLREYPKSAESL